MSILLTGTLAVDHIAEVVDGFQAGDLNGKLDTPATHWGGCAMNLAYGVATADQSGVPWVFYGADAPAEYLDHLQRNGIDLSAMVRQGDARTAGAYIFTRNDHSQLTAFYPGSTRFEPPSASALQAINRCSQWIAGPEDDATLLARLDWVAPATTLYWMPGQYTEVTRSNVLAPMLARQPNLVVNETEWASLQGSVGDAELDRLAGAVYLTRGAAGVSYRLTADTPWQHQASVASKTVDPTGCGDAFCATLVARLAAGDTPAQAVTQAQTRAARCLGFTGAQHH